MIANTQQMMVDDSIRSFMKYNEPVVNEYLTLRQRILEFCGRSEDQPKESKEEKDETDMEVDTNEAGDAPDQEVAEPKEPVETEEVKEVDVENERKKLLLELDLAWESYKSYLNELQILLNIEKLPTKNLEEINKSYEVIIGEKVGYNNKLKNIKNIQMPLIEKMNNLKNNFNTNLNHKTSQRYYKESKEEEIDSTNLLFTKEEITNMFDVDYDFDMNKYNLFTEVKDKLFFKIFKTQESNETLIDEYDELIENLNIDIKESIELRNKARSQWSKNAEIIDQFKDILKQGPQENPEQ
ncbi:hypothetical protein CLIB1444_05S03268 [[Candida] jaroonii]|uniref:Uncharacterized protein n=1 Tax=[Candida] jaroonii TaxID=467808 RepID=A0ACA9Y7V9_9ASCO|nr:hypothetical protein CLIB1444_05S03268 [[Candida] jaroonii]